MWFDLKRIAELTPVVVYDARKTREGQATPHFLELLPVQILLSIHLSSSQSALGRA